MFHYLLNDVYYDGICSCLSRGAKRFIEFFTERREEKGKNKFRARSINSPTKTMTLNRVELSNIYLGRQNLRRQNICADSDQNDCRLMACPARKHSKKMFT